MRTRHLNERGSALLEAAIVIPLLLFVSVAIFEFGRAYQTWEVLTNAAREGARVSVLPDGDVDNVKATVVNFMRGGALPDATTNMVDVDRTVVVNGQTSSQITVNYPFQFMVLQPVANLLTGGGNNTPGSPITMHAAAVMRNEVQ